MTQFYPLKGHEKTHTISKCGRVIRLANKSGVQHSSRRWRRDWELKHYQHEYPRVSIYNKMYMLHRLLYETFVGNIPKDKQINHIDGNKYNHSLTNLELCTGSENLKHAYTTGLRTAPDMNGDLNPAAKLCKDDVLNMREIYNDTRSIKTIASKYPHISNTNLWRICTRRTWKSV